MCPASSGAGPSGDASTTTKDATSSGHAAATRNAVLPPNDSGQLEPMIDQAVTTLQGAGVEGRVGMVLADGGYGHSPQISQLGQDGIDAIVPTKAATRTKARKLSPRQGPEAERIDALLDTPEGLRSTEGDNR